MQALAEGAAVSIWIDKKGRRHVGVMLNGKRVHRVLPKGASASTAKQIESSLRTALGSQRVVRIPGDPQLAEVMGLYLTHASKLRSPITAKFHAGRIGPWIEGKRASEAEHVAAEIIADMRSHYAAATINRSLGTLKKALKLAYKHKLASQDFSGLVERIPENNERTVYLTLPEVTKLANCASENVRTAIWVAVLTGCRRGEVCKIRKADIGEDTIRIDAGNTKTLKRRDVPIVPALRPWLDRLPLPINYEGVKTGFARARVKAGMPHVHFHDLRHSCASILLASGASIPVIAKILGHSSLRSTERYAHLQLDAARAALEKAFG